MEVGIIIIALAVCTGVGFLIYRAWEYSTWDKGCSFEEFKSRNPKSFIKGKFMACPICDGRVMRIMKYRRGTLKKHICKECGRELWRSKD